MSITHSLPTVLNKWRLSMSENAEFIDTLSQQLINEEKLRAIPNILKLSKFKLYFLEIEQNFSQKEELELGYYKDHQYNEIEEDKTLNLELFNHEKLLKKDDDLYIIHYPITDDQRFLKENFLEFMPLLNKMIHFRGTLGKEYYQSYF